MSKILAVIADTNLFVQCKKLEELEWSALDAGVEEIRLIITAPVIEEIDKLKSNHDKLAKRARTANSIVRKFLSTAEVVICDGSTGPKVTIVLGDTYRPSDKYKDDLDYSTADDRLIGIAAGYRDSVSASASTTVIFISHDTGPLIKARRHNLAYFQIPDSWLLKPQDDRDQKLIRELKQELESYKNSEPICEIECGNTPWRFEQSMYQPLTEDQIQGLVAELKQRHPVVMDFSHVDDEARFTSPHSFDRFMGMKQEFQEVTEEQIEEYQENTYPTWLGDCVRILRNLHHLLDDAQSFPSVEISFANTGSRPADDVLVRFVIQGKQLQLCRPPETSDEEGGQSRYPELPSPPVAPKGRWIEHRATSFLEGLYGVQNLTRGPWLSNLPVMPRGLRTSPSIDRNPNAFYWKSAPAGTPGISFELTCKQWRHKRQYEEFVFQVVNPREIGIYKGSIKIEIHASNLSTPAEKIKPVAITTTAIDILPVAMKLIDDLQGQH